MHAVVLLFDVVTWDSWAVPRGQSDIIKLTPDLLNVFDVGQGIIL